MLSSGGTSEPQRNFPTEDDGMAQDSHTERAVWMGERERERQRERARERDRVSYLQQFFFWVQNKHVWLFSREKTM